MIANGFLADAKRRATVGDVLRSKTPLPPLITVQHDDTVKTALDLLRKYEISQIPVMRGHEQVGSVNDVGVMQSVFDHADILHQPVSEVMGAALPGARTVRRDRTCIQALDARQSGDRRHRRRRTDRRAHAPRYHQLSLDQLRRRAKVKFATKAIHVGQEADPATGATIVPIYQTSTYTQTRVGEHKGFDYSRTINPTRLALGTAARLARRGALRQRLRQRHGGDGGRARAALGGRSRGRQRRSLRRNLSPLFARARALRPGVHLRRHERSRRRARRDAACNEAVLGRDADQSAAEARRHRGDRGACGSAEQIVAVDNTFATPYFQQPLALGAQIVVHSTTKYIGGHSDVVGGIAITDDRGAARTDSLSCRMPSAAFRARTTRG